MTSFVVASSHSQMDGLDAARALLGVSPADTRLNSGSDKSSHMGSFVGSRKRVTFPLEYRSYVAPPQDQRRPMAAPAPKVVIPLSPALSTFHPPSTGGLDALAFLASREQASLQQQGTDSSQQDATSSSSDEDSEIMPPPPTRVLGRRRSMSNPEGMQKWESLGSRRNHDRHFVLPPSIIEEELAECNAALEERTSSSGNESSFASADQVLPSAVLEDQSQMSPEELLRKARSRLLEDLSESNITGDKGVLTLPHSLAKYKDVYNQNGRIGIYTRAERAAIIARFNSKRTKRVWNKKIRYNCRKNLADRRMRVKGRFVKRSVQLTFPISENTMTPPGSESEPAGITEDQKFAKEDMPDITDPDAGFCPTEDQPYRRLRRHTIT